MSKLEDRDRINLRLSHDTLAKIEIACSRRIGKVSRNTWIAEAIEEKLARDSAANDDLEPRRRANG